MNPYPNGFYRPVPPEREASYFAQQRRLRRRNPRPTTNLDVAAIADVDNLAACYEILKQENGTAPGPDRVRFDDIGRSELYAILRPTSEAILSGTYRPGPARAVKIPKAGNRGYRTLTIRNLIDRVVAKAVYEASLPYWEDIFLDGSHGFRPRRSNWTMLASLGRVMAEQDRWALVSDDVTSAFPSLQIDRVLEHHREHLGSNPLLITLIETILRGGDPSRAIGLDQGSPYMPLALNVHLHHVFDLNAHELGGDPGCPTPWWRYADNLVVACRHIEEGQRVLQSMRQRLGTVGLTLKGENDGLPVNLRQGRSVQLLGFSLYRSGNQLGIKLGAGAWTGMKENLLRAHEQSHPAQAAEAAIDGWIDSYGPAFGARQHRSVAYLLQLASDYGFRELYSPDYYLSRCRGAYQRWLNLRSGRPARAATADTDLSTGGRP